MGMYIRRPQGIFFIYKNVYCIIVRTSPCRYLLIVERKKKLDNNFKFISFIVNTLKWQNKTEKLLRISINDFIKFFHSLYNCDHKLKHFFSFFFLSVLQLNVIKNKVTVMKKIVWQTSSKIFIVFLRLKE